MFNAHNSSAHNAYAAERESYLAQLASGANWFYWIAALTLVTTVIQVFGGNFSFAIGLGLTQIIEGLAQGVSEELGGGVGVVRIVGTVLQLALIALFAGFGFLANKGWVWVFIVGMVIYALDGLIFIFAASIVGIIIHALGLYFLFTGLSAAWNLKKLGHS